MPTPDHDFHVINLERRPDRRDSFLRCNADVSGLSFNFTKAVDSRELDLDALVASGLLSEQATFAPGHLACGLSHRQLWLEAIEGDGSFYICEDDAIFRNDFTAQWKLLSEHLPADWDIVLFGYNFDSSVSMELIPGVQEFLGWFNNVPIDTRAIDRFLHCQNPVLITRLYNAFGTLAYAVSAKGAEKLIKRCFPMHNEEVPIRCLHRVVRAFSVDCLMNQYYREWNSYAVFPPLAISPNDKTQSDTT